MTPLVLADALGLAALFDRAKPPMLPFRESMTRLVEDKKLGFPHDVVLELDVIDRGGLAAAWASGLGSHLDPFKPDIAYARPLMGHVQAVGFESGFRQVDGKDPALASVGRLACEQAAKGTEFVILTADTGEHPLRPTMEQLCRVAGWAMIKPKACMKMLSL